MSVVNTMGVGLSLLDLCVHCPWHFTVTVFLHGVETWKRAKKARNAYVAVSVVEAYGMVRSV